MVMLVSVLNYTGRQSLKDLDNDKIGHYMDKIKSL